MSEQKLQYDPPEEALQDYARIRALRGLYEVHIAVAHTVPVSTSLGDVLDLPVTDQVVGDNLSEAARARLKELEEMATADVFINTAEDDRHRLSNALQNLEYLLPEPVWEQTAVVMRQHQLLVPCRNCGYDLLPLEQDLEEECPGCGAPLTKDGN